MKSATGKHKAAFQAQVPVMVRGYGCAEHFSLSAERQLLTQCPFKCLINADSQMPNLMKNHDEGLAGITNALTAITLSL